MIRSPINPVSEEGSLFDVPPAALGRFRVLHQIGAGTLGPVFRATDPGSDTVVAIKLLTINLFPQDAANVSRALAELVAAVPRLPAAVTPIEAGLEHHVPFLATTLADGDSLDVALREFGPAAIADMLPRVRALADTLDSAARGDVFHGALHPRDILVAEHDTRMTGLGIVPILARHGVKSMGRRPYAAPEVADNQFSGEADQFALATLTFEWMTGRKANGSATEVPALPGVARAAMADVFARALHDDPAQRFESCTSFIEALTAAAGDAATMAEPTPVVVVPTTPARTTRTRTRKPALPLDDFPAEGPEESSEAGGTTLDEVTPIAVDSIEQAVAAASLHGAAPELPAERFTSVDPPRASHDPLPPIHRAPVLGSTLSISDPPRAVQPSTRTGPGRMLAAAIVGIVLGVAGGYFLWGGSASSSAGDPAVVDEPTSPPAQPSTDVALEPSPSGSGAAGGTAAASGAPAAPTGSSAAPPAVAVPVAGRLLVRSDPSGATVFVDNEWRGVTPLTLTGLDLGTRRIRVQRDGYATQERAVSLTRERPSRSVDVSLPRRAATAPARPAAAPPASPAVRTGSLLVESRPAGATVTVNGSPRGLSPLTLSGLAPGEYTVQLQLAGYRTITTTVRVVAGERARAAASLTEQERE